MKKAWLRLGAAALALTMLTACGGNGGTSGGDSDSASSDPNESFKLRISTTGESDDGLDIAMRMFKEKYPNVEYEIITSPLEELRNKQLMLLSMDDIPDIGKMKDWNKEFYKDDLVIDMGPYVEKWGLKDKLTDAQLERMTADGVMSAITFNNTTTLALYNKTILNELGVEPPKTFDELEDLGKLIKEKNLKTPDGNQVFATYVPTGIWGEGSWVWTLGGDYMNEDYTKCIIDSPESVAAHTKMQEFVKNGYAPVPDGTQNQLWLNGQLAVYFAGEWSQEASDDAGMDYGFMTVPAGKDGIGWSSLGGCNWAIFKDAPNKDKALEFLQLMYSDEFQIEADRGVTDMAIYDNPEKIKKWTENGVIEAKKKQQEQLQHTRYNFMECCYKYPDGAKIYQEALERILVNSEDPQNVLSDAAARITEGIAANS